jgi:DUF2971 family protein
MLYRFVDLAGFVAMLAKSCMFLRQVTAWADPYETDALSKLVEHVLSKTPAPEDIKKRITDRTARMIYAQSWTELRESDALWRIYSPDRKGIRIGVEQDAIRDQIAQIFPDVRGFKIRYCLMEDARLQLEKSFKKNKSIGLAECCRFKRPEFEHEKEYRFCIVEKAPSVDLNHWDWSKESDHARALDLLGTDFPQLKSFPFSPALIKEVALDPRLDLAKETWFYGAICDLCKMKGLKASITISDLYTR